MTPPLQIQAHGFGMLLDSSPGLDAQDSVVAGSALAQLKLVCKWYLFREMSDLAIVTYQRVSSAHSNFCHQTVELWILWGGRQVSPVTTTSLIARLFLGPNQITSYIQPYTVWAQATWNTSISLYKATWALRFSLFNTFFLFKVHNFLEFELVPPSEHYHSLHIKADTFVMTHFSQLLSLAFNNSALWQLNGFAAVIMPMAW